MIERPPRPRRGALTAALAIVLGLLLPGRAAAVDVVDVEMLIASSNGRYYVILQQDGELEIVRRSERLPPIRSRRGEARPTMEELRLGGTAEQMARASGLKHGIEPEPGDAIIGTARLRDPLDRLDVFGDGTGFVARYSSSPTRYDDLEPIRATDGADEGLVTVESKPIGEDRVVASFVHLYTRKDAVFWGDPARQLVMMVAGGDALAFSADRGAFLPDRDSGKRPRMVAWSYSDRGTVEPPIAALLDRMHSPDPDEGLRAFLLAREIDFRSTLAALPALVEDEGVPHPTRLHAATTLHAEGDPRGDALILGTARGVRGPGPFEAPGSLGLVRAYAVGVLPITHPELAPSVLLGLAADPDVGELARETLLAGPWASPGALQRAAVDSARDLSRAPAERAAAAAALVSLAGPAPVAPSGRRRGPPPAPGPLEPMLLWLAGDPDPAVHALVLEARPLAADSVVVPRWADTLTSESSTPSERRDAAWWLASRGWRSEEAREALVRVAGTPGGGPGAPEALGVSWRLDDPRVLPILVQRSASSGPEAAAALHALLTVARRSEDRGPYIEGLDKLPALPGWRGRSVVRLLAVLDPSRASRVQ